MSHYIPYVNETNTVGRWRGWDLDFLDPGRLCTNVSRLFVSKMEEWPIGGNMHPPKNWASARGRMHLSTKL